MKALSFREYAAHRAELGLSGRSHESVRRAVKSGRLHRSLARDDAGNVTGIADAAAADKEWQSNTRVTAATARRAAPAAAPEELLDPTAPGAPVPYAYHRQTDRIATALAKALLERAKDPHQAAEKVLKRIARSEWLADPDAWKFLEEGEEPETDLELLDELLSEAADELTADRQ